jgi:hypothetical protein
LLTELASIVSLTQATVANVATLARVPKTQGSTASLSGALLRPDTELAFDGQILRHEIALRCHPRKALAGHFKKPRECPSLLSNAFTSPSCLEHSGALSFSFDMWLSTIWVAVSIVLTADAHPTTATIALCFWILHRRWEKATYTEA